MKAKRVEISERNIDAVNSQQSHSETLNTGVQTITRPSIETSTASDVRESTEMDDAYEDVEVNGEDPTSNDDRTGTENKLETYQMPTNNDEAIDMEVDADITAASISTNPSQHTLTERQDNGHLQSGSSSSLGGSEDYDDAVSLPVERSRLPYMGLEERPPEIPVVYDRLRKSRIVNDSVRLSMTDLKQ